jgi:hypothetical protein
VRCPECAARNPAEAEWCSQCYLPLREVEDEAPGQTEEATQDPGTEPDARGSGGSAGLTEAAVGEDAGGPELKTVVRERFRSTEEGFEWRCLTCESWVVLERSTCHVCGASFPLSSEDEDEIPKRDPGTVLIVSAALPGAGHIVLGRRGDGILRAATYVAWIGGAWLLIRAGRGTDVPIVPAISLLLGALAMWIVSAVDAVRLAQGDRTQLLTPRVYLWLVVGVIGLLVFGFLPGLLRIGQLGG